MNPSPTTEERIWAVFSHLSALAFGMGIMLPIIGWSEQRSKSKYASFQCLQALGYQSLGYTIWLLTYILLIILCLFVLVIVSFFGEKNGSSSGTVNILWSGVFVFFFLGLIAVYLLLPVIAAIACGLGKDFRYPILGRRLARYLGYGSSDETGEAASLKQAHEERWVASMGHFSVIIAIWGLIAPVTTWVLQGKRSAFLKFQSIQTTVYQAVVNLLFLGAGGLYFSGLVVIFAVMMLSRGQARTAPGGIFSIIVFFGSLLIAAVIILAIPLFHILGQWAGYRVLKGDDYHYPIIGNLVEKRLAKS